MRSVGSMRCSFELAVLLAMSLMRRSPLHRRCCRMLAHPRLSANTEIGARRRTGPMHLRSIPRGGFRIGCAPPGPMPGLERPELMNRPTSLAEPPAAPHLCAVLALLWLGGAAIRIPLLAVPPIIPLIHDDLHM